MKKILITGGAGFIGSHLAKALVDKNYKVTVLDNLMRSTLNNIKALIDDGKVEFIDGDVRYGDAVNQAMKGADYVFHEAAICIKRSMAFPNESRDINLNGSQIVFQAALDHNVKKVIFASSASVYGNPKKLPMEETDELSPLTPYCIAKLATENFAKFYATRGLKFIGLRYFNVYGVKQSTDAYYTSVINLFIKKLLNRDTPVIDGDGSQSMDFVNVKDVVQANILAMESNVKNEVFNVGSGTSTTIAELAKMIIKNLNLDAEPQFNHRDVLVSERKADISKIQKMLGFKPTIEIDKGLKEVCEDIAKNPDEY